MFTEKSSRTKYIIIYFTANTLSKYSLMSKVTFEDDVVTLRHVGTCRYKYVNELENIF